MQRLAFDLIMVWHQGLHNPIPNFNLHLTTEVRLPKPKSERPPPMTWGQVKATTYQAQQQLNQASLQQTPENLVAAAFSIITANSLHDPRQLEEAGTGTGWN
uniref:Rec21/ENK19 domain-containing protein n=1 Tax=Naja naja TaxID=35670 RepID=A0A8C6X1P5_NAJNA